MATDIERSYKGTNFAVITLLVLLTLVGIYLVTAQVRDVRDDAADIAPAVAVDAQTGSAPADRE